MYNSIQSIVYSVHIGTERQLTNHNPQEEIN